MKYIISKKWTNKTGQSGKSYYMGTVDIPMFGESLQTSSKITDAKVFDSEESAKPYLNIMGKNAEIEQVNI
jgi:hypothetical protein